MNELKIFENSEFGEIETVVLNGQPLFNPYDIGKCLEMDKVTVRRHIAKMNNKKRVLLKSELNEHLPELNIPSRGLVFLTKSGVFSMILKSRKPEAEQFHDWITDEVLPEIEETGAYNSGPKLPALDNIKRESIIKELEEFHIAKAPEIANIGKQTERAKLAILISTLSHEKHISTEILYERLYGQYAAHKGLYIPLEANSRGKSNSWYLRNHAIISKELYEFALLYFYQGKSVVELFNWDSEQKTLAEF